MSDPAGWYATSVTPSAASPAIFSDTCSPVPVNPMKLANGMRVSDVRLVTGVCLDQVSLVDHEMSLSFGVRLDRLTPCLPGSASTAVAPPRS
jgi:hypothetical protein